MASYTCSRPTITTRIGTRNTKRITNERCVPKVSIRSVHLSNRKRTSRDASTRARINDPDMLGEEDADAIKGSPSALWRAVAAAMYLIPWMDCLMLGRFIFQEWTSFQIFHDLPMPLLMIYGCNAFMPLVIFFVLFLCVVRNTKLPHFLRFSAMQSIMLDIVVMLANILVMYAPSEVTHSILMPILMNCSFISILATIFYCMIHTLAGRYCDLPWISEAVYIQVTASEFG